MQNVSDNTELYKMYASRKAELEVQLWKSSPSTPDFTSFSSRRKYFMFRFII
jgi:hypothetical protein